MWMLRLQRFVRVMGKGGWMLLWALRNAQTPWWIKLATAAMLVYLVSPLDFVPDWPIIGWFDDAALLMVAIPFLVDKLPESVRAQANQASQRSSLRRWFGGVGFGKRT